MKQNIWCVYKKKLFLCLNAKPSTIGFYTKQKSLYTKPIVCCSMYVHTHANWRLASKTPASLFFKQTFLFFFLLLFLTRQFLNRKLSMIDVLVQNEKTTRTPFPSRSVLKITFLSRTIIQCTGRVSRS